MTVEELHAAFKKDFEPQFKELTFFAVFRKEKPAVDPVNKSLGSHEIIDPALHKIGLFRPFIYHIKRLPKAYKGFKIEYAVSYDTVPFEFGEEMERMLPLDVFYSEEKIIQYAEEHADEICIQLNDYTLIIKDICDIIAGGDFEQHKRMLQKEKLNQFSDDDDDLE